MQNKFKIYRGDEGNKDTLAPDAREMNDTESAMFEEFKGVMLALKESSGLYNNFLSRYKTFISDFANHNKDLKEICICAGAIHYAFLESDFSKAEVLGIDEHE